MPLSEGEELALLIIGSVDLLMEGEPQTFQPEPSFTWRLHLLPTRILAAKS